MAWSLLHNRLVDRLCWIVAPKIIGGRESKTSVEGEGISDLARAIPCRNVRVSPLGVDWLFEAEVAA